MTYCVGVLLHDGLVCASDSRTNAGIDHVSSFKKMKVFERPGDRVLVMMSAGNLSVSQNVLNQLELSGRRTDAALTIWSAQSLVEVASLLGDTLREVRGRDLPFLQANNIDANVTFILGGQIRGEPMRLFLVYSEGNFIESTPETPFFQIGETKYGKPIIDRVITPASTLVEAEKCLLVSFDSTMRSNVSVGLPITAEVLVIAAYQLRPKDRATSLDSAETYAASLRSALLASGWLSTTGAIVTFVGSDIAAGPDGWLWLTGKYLVSLTVDLS